MYAHTMFVGAGAISSAVEVNGKVLLCCTNTQLIPSGYCFIPTQSIKDHENTHAHTHTYTHKQTGKCTCTYIFAHFDTSLTRTPA